MSAFLKIIVISAISLSLILIISQFYWRHNTIRTNQVAHVLPELLLRKYTNLIGGNESQIGSSSTIIQEWTSTKDGGAFAFCRLSFDKGLRRESLLMISRQLIEEIKINGYRGAIYLQITSAGFEVCFMVYSSDELGESMYRQFIALQSEGNVILDF